MIKLINWFTKKKKKQRKDLVHPTAGQIKKHSTLNSGYKFQKNSISSFIKLKFLKLQIESVTNQNRMRIIGQNYTMFFKIKLILSFLKSSTRAQNHIKFVFGRNAMCISAYLRKGFWVNWDGYFWEIIEGSYCGYGS